MICLNVKLTAKPGHENKIAEMFTKLQEASRREPGCLLYAVHRHAQNPLKFLVYEQYKDDAALQAHRDSQHFEAYAQNGIYPLIENREADIYLPI